MLGLSYRNLTQGGGEIFHRGAGQRIYQNSCLTHMGVHSRSNMVITSRHLFWDAPKSPSAPLLIFSDVLGHRFWEYLRQLLEHFGRIFFGRVPGLVSGPLLESLLS